MSTDALLGTASVDAMPDVAEVGAAVLTDTGAASADPLSLAAQVKGSGAAPVLCHYCGMLPGATIDHIVPRVLLPRAERMLGMVTENSVKACQHCNGRKSAYRVDCCERCLDAWRRWGPADWETTVAVVSKIWVAKKARALARQ